MNERGKVATFFLGPKEVAEPVSQTRSEDPIGYPEGPLPGLVPSKAAVSINEALSVSAVYASINIICNWVTQMDLSAYRVGEELATPSLVAQPDTDSTQYEFIKETVTSLALTGNAYWKVTRRQSDGVAIALEVLNPQAMVVYLNEAGKKEYRYSGYKGDPRTYTTKQVQHLKTFEVPGRLTGLSPVEANAGGLAGELLLRDYAANWFGDGRSVRQHFSVDHTMDGEELAEYIRRVQEQKAKGYGDLVTDRGTTISNLSLNPNDAAYVDLAQFTKTEIACTWFGIPSGLVGASVDGNSMTYSNLQTDLRLFVSNTLMGYMKPIEEAFTALLPRGQVVRFKTEALLRADTQTRYEAYAKAIDAGFMTADEARAAEGWKPLTSNEKETAQAA